MEMKTPKPITQKQSDARLYALARLLEALPPERFYFGHWVGGNYQGKPDLSCGTTACALGWATTMKSLRKSGLRIGQPNMPFTLMTPYCCVDGRDGTPAAMYPLGLTHNEANYLFMWNMRCDGHNKESPSKDATAKEVAAHIRQFVKRRRELTKPEAK